MSGFRMPIGRLSSRCPLPWWPWPLPLASECFSVFIPLGAPANSTQSRRFGTTSAIGLDAHCFSRHTRRTPMALIELRDLGKTYDLGEVQVHALITVTLD